MQLKELQTMVHNTAVNNGWWEKDVPVPTIAALFHSEVSEMFEAYRNHDEENMREELADIVIRVLDFCGAKDIDLESEIIKKDMKNRSRGYKHGGKKC